MKTANFKEKAGKTVFTIAAMICVIAVIAIFGFMLVKSLPAFRKIGFFNFVFGDNWSPDRLDKYDDASLSGTYGVFKMIIGTLAATVGALVIGGTLGYFTAGFIAFYCPERLKKIFGKVELDAGITKKNESDKAPLAPGMKYRHYAPHAEVFLLLDSGKGEFDKKAVGFLSEKLAADPSAGVICFDEYMDKIKGENVFYFGRKDDDGEHARRLFDILRRFDKTNAKVIYATASDTKGVGLAIFNRMLKASGFNTIEI